MRNMEEIVASLIKAMFNGLGVIIVVFFIILIPIHTFILYLIVKSHDDIKKLGDKFNAKNDSLDESGNKTKTDSDKEQLM